MEKPQANKQSVTKSVTKSQSNADITRRTWNDIRNKYYCLYEKLDKMEHKPRLKYAIEDAKETYRIAQKLADFMKVAVEKLEAYENPKEK